MNETDRTLLTQILVWADEHDPDGERFRVQPFREMLGRERPLSDKQRSWAKSLHERMYNEPQYENLVSSGRAPRGREVATPAVLQNRPLKPPVKRVGGE